MVTFAITLNMSLTGILFAETTTLGLRFSSAERPASSSTDTGCTGIRTNAASSVSARSKSRTSHASKAEVSGIGRTRSVACVRMPNVPNDPAIRRHIL